MKQEKFTTLGSTQTLWNNAGQCSSQNLMSSLWKQLPLCLRNSHQDHFHKKPVQQNKLLCWCGIFKERRMSGSSRDTCEDMEHPAVPSPAGALVPRAPQGSATLSHLHFTPLRGPLALLLHGENPQNMNSLTRELEEDGLQTTTNLPWRINHPLHAPNYCTSSGRCILEGTHSTWE